MMAGTGMLRLSGGQQGETEGPQQAEYDEELQTTRVKATAEVVEADLPQAAPGPLTQGERALLAAMKKLSINDRFGIPLVAV